MESPTKSERERAIDELVILIQEHLDPTFRREHMNEKGIKLLPDEVDTLNYFRRYAIAPEFILGLIFLTYTVGEHGAKQDYCGAYMWFTRTVVQGHEHKEDALTALRNLKILMPPEQLIKAERMVEKLHEQNNKRVKP